MSDPRPVPPCSLLVPCYQAADVLPRLAETVRAQTVPFAEWICYDDASGDNTAEMAESLGARVIRGEVNGGPSVARNAAARAASCEWIHFHDADDIMEPHLLEKTEALMIDGVDAVVGRVDWVEEQTRETWFSIAPRDEELRADALDKLIRRPVGVIGVTMRRGAFLAAGGFDESIRCYEDSDVFVRMAGKGARFRAIDDRIAFSLRHERGISNDRSYCQDVRLELLKKYRDAFGERAFPALRKASEALLVGMVKSKRYDKAAEVADFCRSVGGDPPTTGNPLLKILKRVLPPVAAMRVQWAVRKRASGFDG